VSETMFDLAAFHAEIARGDLDGQIVMLPVAGPPEAPCPNLGFVTLSICGRGSASPVETVRVSPAGGSGCWHQPIADLLPLSPEARIASRDLGEALRFAAWNADTPYLYLRHRVRAWFRTLRMPDQIEIVARLPKRLRARRRRWMVNWGRVNRSAVLIIGTMVARVRAGLPAAEPKPTKG